MAQIEHVPRPLPVALEHLRYTFPNVFRRVSQDVGVQISLQRKCSIRNGETPPLHAHPDRVIVYLSPCAWLEQDGEGGTRMQSYKFGEPTWAPAETHGGVTANVVEQCSLLEIELK